MKRFLHCLIIVFLINTVLCPSKAEAKLFHKKQQSQEIQILETETDAQNIQVVNVESDNSSSLKVKLKESYNIEVDKYDKPEYLFKEALTYRYDDNSRMDNVHIWGAYNAYGNINISENGNPDGKYVSNALNIGFDGFLKNKNADFRIMVGFPIDSTRNYVQTLFSDVYIASDKIPHHRVQIGHFRPQVGYEGGNSAYTLPFLNRSQISRNFGTARRIGGRIKGDYKFADYDIGMYSSDTFFEEFFPGAEFVGWINIKPFANRENKYGKLKIGAGIDGGHRKNNFFVTGAHIGYEYKRFSADFEWANANGYNGYYGDSAKHASGFYSTLGYMITNKVQLLARYDQFNPDKTLSNNKREYSLGINYFIKGQALRLIMNYVFSQNDNAKDSHRIMFGAQILI